MSDKDPGEMKELDLEKFKPNGEFEVIVAEEEGEEDENLEEASAEDTDQDDSDENQDEIDDEKTSPKRKAKKSNRAEKRIRDLARKNKELLARTQELEASSKEAKDNFLQERKRSSEISLTVLEDREKSIKNQLIDAAESNDTAQIIELTTELGKVQSNIGKVSEYIPTLSEDKKEDKPKEVTPKDLTFEEQIAQLPEEGQAWIEENPSFIENPAFRAKAIREGKILEIRGVDPFSEEYWEQLTEVMNDKSKSKRKTRKKAPVTTSSRVTRTGNKTTVRLSPDERDMAKRMGMSPEAYAKRVHEVEQSTDVNGYTEIKIG